MTCSIMRFIDNPSGGDGVREAIAREGWSPEEIKLMEQEIELARRKAEAQAFSEGRTLREQQDAMDRAVKDKVKELHDREHAKLADISKQVKDMAEFRKKHPGHHYSPDKVKVTPDGEEDK